MEKIRAGHMDMLADVRQSYQTEMARVKSEVERSVAEVRGADAQDMHRVKENFTIRYVNVYAVVVCDLPWWC